MRFMVSWWFVAAVPLTTPAHRLPGRRSARTRGWKSVRAAAPECDCREQEQHCEGDNEWSVLHGGPPGRVRVRVCLEWPPSRWRLATGRERCPNGCDVLSHIGHGRSGPGPRTSTEQGSRPAWRSDSCLSRAIDRIETGHNIGASSVQGFRRRDRAGRCPRVRKYMTAREVRCLPAGDPGPNRGRSRWSSPSR
jgi:hypothetical protein